MQLYKVFITGLIFTLVSYCLPPKLYANNNQQDIGNENSCSTQVHGNGNNIFCVNIDPKAVAREISQTLNVPNSQPINNLLNQIDQHQSNQSSVSSGVYGVLYLRWLDIPNHEGYIIMNGNYGLLRVAYLNYSTGIVEYVDQNISLIFNQQGVPFLVGSSVRYAGTSTPNSTYLPDIFRLDYNSQTNLFHLFYACDAVAGIICSRINAQTVY